MKVQALSNAQYRKETHSGPWNEITTVVKKACAGSASGLNGVTYKLYKKCDQDSPENAGIVTHLEEGNSAGGVEIGRGLICVKGEERLRTIGQSGPYILLYVFCSVN